MALILAHDSRFDCHNHINFFNAATHSFSAGTGFSMSPSYSITSGPVKFTCLSVAMNFGRSRLPWPMMTSLGTRRTVVDEILDVYAVQAIAEFRRHLDGVLFGVDRPGGVQVQADARAGFFEDVVEDDRIAEPVISAVIVDAQFQVVLIREFFDVLQRALEQGLGPERDAHVLHAGLFAELESWAVIGDVAGQSLDADGDDLDAGLAKLIDDRRNVEASPKLACTAQISVALVPVLFNCSINAGMALK